jgi:hypothetical protein
LFGGNGGLPRSIIGNPKYLDGPRSHGGPGGSEPPLLGSNGCLVKILSTSLGIFICTLTSVSFGVWGLDLILTIVWASAVTNGV